MKTKTLVLIFTLVLAVLVIIGSCATRKKAISEADFFEAYSGTWINKDYSGSTFEPQKLIHFPDGTWEYYSLLTVDQRRCYGKDTMIDMWTDSNGNFWYKTSWECFTHNQKGFTMRKISDSGNTHEMLFRFGDEPIEEWDPDNTWIQYLIHYRQ